MYYFFLDNNHPKHFPEEDKQEIIKGHKVTIITDDHDIETDDDIDSKRLNTVTEEQSIEANEQLESLYEQSEWLDNDDQTETKNSNTEDIDTEYDDEESKGLNTEEKSIEDSNIEIETDEYEQSQISDSAENWYMYQ